MTISITGQGIPMFRLLTMRSAVVLEGKGLKFSRGSMTAKAKRELGLSRGAKREIVLAGLDEAIRQQEGRLSPGEIAVSGEEARPSLQTEAEEAMRVLGHVPSLWAPSEGPVSSASCTRCAMSAWVNPLRPGAHAIWGDAVRLACVEEACSDACLPHAPDCDGFCDHLAGHRNACLH